jgi:hypothetical protein
VVDGQLRGMGGWLLVFTLTMTVRPLLSLLGVLGVASLMMLEPDPAPAFSLYVLLTLAIAVYTGWAAYTLWALKPTALISVRNYFGGLLVYALLVVDGKSSVGNELPGMWPERRILSGG